MTSLKERPKPASKATHFNTVNQFADLEPNRIDDSITQNLNTIRKNKASNTTAKKVDDVDSSKTPNGSRNIAKRVCIDEEASPRRTKSGKYHTTSCNDLPNEIHSLSTIIANDSKTNDVPSSTQLGAVESHDPNSHSLPSKAAEKTKTSLKKFIFQESDLSVGVTSEQPSHALSEIAGLSKLCEITDQDLEFD